MPLSPAPRRGRRHAGRVAIEGDVDRGLSRTAAYAARVSRREIRSWLMDMDGVLVHEESAIPGAADFLDALRAAGTPFLVLTNNSIYTRRDLVARLRASGLEVPEERIWTSALATANFLEEQRPGARPSSSARRG